MRTGVATLVAAASLGRAWTQEEGWRPEPQPDGKFDWVQMTSGEWLKGEFIVMYDESLEFDSEEFEDLVLDWDDVRQVRTAQVVNVGLLGRRTATGTLVVEGDKVVVKGEEVQEFKRDEVISITAGVPKEINFWSMKVFFGFDIRSGNSSVRDVSVQANVERRTVSDRHSIDFVGNENTTEGERIADSQRVNAAWDRFVSDRVFLKPVAGEYYRDSFQNIGSRVTLGVGAGYQLMDSTKIDWEISGGPAFQGTWFDDVAPGDSDSESTPALAAETTASWDITRWAEFDGEFRFQLVNDESGTYNHHMLVSFETDITKLIDFDVSWIWDRILNPRPNADGTVPEQNDFRTTVGLTFDF